MSLELGMWRIDRDTVAEVSFLPMEAESRLERILDRNIGIAAPHLMVIGRQVRTAFDKVLDLLAIDIEGNLTALELKKDKTYRDIVAQVLDYGSWIRTLRADDIARIFQEYLTRWHPQRKQSINEAFCTHFKVKQMPDDLNGDHDLVVVAAHLDPSTERIVEYLAEHHGVNINVVFFRFFQDGEREYLSRAWLRDPTTSAEDTGTEVASSKEWNGEYYVSFGLEDTRDWNEATKYGFISGGGGSWYSNTLSLLEPGARIWVNVPATGYVGVGEVVEPRAPVEKFMVKGSDGNLTPITELPLAISRARKVSEDPDKGEYLVRVKWLKTVPVSHAIKEKGFFGNQNTVARPRTPKWDHTVERLKARFSIS